ncbi:MAG: DUF2811 domain-containing protein [Nostoc sp.]
MSYCNGRDYKSELFAILIINSTFPGRFHRLSTNSTQNIFTTLPETLHQSLNTYLEKHPDWDEHRLITAAISLFLLQNADGDRGVSQVYLETLFRRG